METCVYCSGSYIRTSDPFIEVIDGVDVKITGVERDECISCNEFFPTIEGQRIYEKQIELALRSTRTALSAHEIKTLRKKMGMTQKEMGDFIGVTDVSLSRWENGISLPTAPANKLLTALRNLEEQDSLGIAFPDSQYKKPKFWTTKLKNSGNKISFELSLSMGGNTSPNSQQGFRNIFYQGSVA